MSCFLFHSKMVHHIFILFRQYKNKWYTVRKMFYRHIGLFRVWKIGQNNDGNQGKWKRKKTYITEAANLWLDKRLTIGYGATVHNDRERLFFARAELKRIWRESGHWANIASAICHVPRGFQFAAWTQPVNHCW